VIAQWIKDVVDEDVDPADLQGSLKTGTVLCELVPPWRRPRGKSMVSSVNSHTNATRIGWHLWEIDLRFAPGLPPGWLCMSISGLCGSLAFPFPDVFPCGALGFQYTKSPLPSGPP